MRLESSEGCQRCRRDRLVELAAAGETGQTRPPSAAGVSWRKSYPVTLGGLDGLLAGRRARAHAVGLLAVCGVSVGLASRASLDLV